MLRESVSEYRQVNHLDELGWALAHLGFTLVELGDGQEGVDYLCEALQIGLDTRATQSANYALVGFAVILGCGGDPVRALELYSLACRHPSLSKARWLEDVFKKRIFTSAGSLSPETIAGAQERGRALDLWQVADDLLKDEPMLAQLAASHPGDA